jgi:hypothetical protein
LKNEARLYGQLAGLESKSYVCERHEELSGWNLGGHDRGGKGQLGKRLSDAHTGASR